MNKGTFQKKLVVTLAGFLHALKSCIAIGLIVGCVALLVAVASNRGYVAVFKFAAAAVVLFLAIMLLYSCGKDLHWRRFYK